MRGLRPANAAWKVPTILTDASPQIELVRHLWLDMKLAGDIAVDRRATFHVLKTPVSFPGLWTQDLTKGSGKSEIHGFAFIDMLPHVGAVGVLLAVRFARRSRLLAELEAA